jgi:DNA-binding response OmpR family regulator
MKILVIDDDPMVRQMLTRLFETHDVEVEAVASGAEANEALERDGHDIVLVDYKLRFDEDGFQVINDLGSRFPSQKFAMLSTWVDELADLPSAAQGNFVFIPKTLDPKKIVAKVFEITGKPFGGVRK